ncbi:MAG: ECF transporter S component [Ruminococcaceae bacterium]|nr:ECF transporter S component [Oscillospiraceae bacterium]
MKKLQVKTMVLLAMLAAIAFLLVALVRIPVVMFLSYEPKDVVIAIGGFLLGPLSSFVISLVVSLLEMVTISTTGPIGAVMNLLSSCSFACMAAVVYKRKRTLGGAVWGLAAGSVVMIGVMLLWNYLITPLYMTGTSRSDVAAMLIPVFLPFNALKAGFNAALTLLLYKPLVRALRKTGLIENRQSKADTSRAGLYLLAALLLVTCILLLLVFRGII